MNLIFYNTFYYLESLTKYEESSTTTDNNIRNQCPVSFLMVLGEPLILRNIKIAKKRLKFDKILIPKGLHSTLKLVQEAFPHIDIDEFSDKKDNRRSVSNSQRNATLSSKQASYSKVTIGGAYQDTEIPLNACLYYSEIAKSLFMDHIIYPWDFLNLVQKVLHVQNLLKIDN